MQVSIGNGISIHINMHMIIGVCRSVNVNISIRIIHSQWLRLKVSAYSSLLVGSESEHGESFDE